MFGMVKRSGALVSKNSTMSFNQHRHREAIPPQLEGPQIWDKRVNTFLRFKTDMSFAKCRQKLVVTFEKQNVLEVFFSQI